MINRAVLDEILLDHGISKQWLAVLKIELKEGRGPLISSLNRLFPRKKHRELGIYYSMGHRKEGTIELYPEEIERNKSGNLSDFLAHECAHAITDDGSWGIHPFLLVAYLLPPCCEPWLLLLGVLSLVASSVFALTGMAERAVAAAIVGVLLLDFIQALPKLCYEAYRRSPKEVKAREKAVELLADLRWKQVISSDS